MCKRLLTLASALLFAAVAYTQENPSSTPGSETANPLGQGQVDCSDPLMAASSLCTGDLNSTTLRGGFSGATGSPQVPYPTQNRVITYTDEAGRPVSREKSTNIALPPEPLTEFQKFTAATTGMVLPIFGA